MFVLCMYVQAGKAKLTSKIRSIKACIFWGRGFNTNERKKEYEVNKAEIKLKALMGVTDPLKANVPDCQIPPYSANATALLLLPPEILF